MLTYKQRLALYGFESLSEWVDQNGRMEFRLLLRVNRDFDDPTDVTKQDRYFAVFSPWCNNTMVEISFVKYEGLSNGTILRFANANHVLAGTKMITNVPMSSVDEEFVAAEAFANAKIAMAKEAKKKGLPYRPEARPHTIYEYLMRRDIAILEKNRH